MSVTHVYTLLRWDVKWFNFCQHTLLAQQCVSIWPQPKIGPKNTVEDINHLKIQHYLTTQKNIAAMTSIQKIQIFEIQNKKKYSADPCLYIYAKSTPWDFGTTVEVMVTKALHITFRSKQDISPD